MPTPLDFTGAEPRLGRKTPKKQDWIRGDPEWVAFVARIPFTRIQTSGFVPVVSGGSVVMPPPFIWAMTPMSPPSVQGGASVQVPRSDVTLQAMAPNVGQGLLINVPQASIGPVQGYPPVIATGAQLSVPQAGVALTCYAPVVYAGAQVSIPYAGIAHLGYVPQVRQDFPWRIIVPSFAAIVAAGFEPIVSTGAVVVMPGAAGASLLAYVPGVEGSNPPVLTFRASAVSTTNASSYTFASQAIGPAAADRNVIVAVNSGRTSSTATGAIPSSVTVGGVAATKLAEHQMVADGVAVGQSLWGVLLPAGTTASIVATYAAAQIRQGIAVFSLNYSTFVPANTNGTFFVSTNDVTTTVSVGAGDVGLIMASGGHTTAATYTTTWTGATKTHDQLVESSQSFTTATFTSSGTVRGANGYNAGQGTLWASWGKVVPLATYRYFRWRVTETRTTTQAEAQASEFRLLSNGFDFPTPASITQSGWTGVSTEGPEKLWDTSTATKWNDQSHQTKGASEIVFDFTTPKLLTSYDWSTANDTTGRDPSGWTIEGSNDLSTWDVLHTVTGFVATTTRQTWVGQQYL